MTINLHLPQRAEMLKPTITVIGVGGAGGNAVNNMIASNLEGVNFVVANTDAQALDHSMTERTIQLGAGITKGLGAGANPEVGRAAAEEAKEEVAAYIEGSNMVFITAGMGGGTGTGAAPVVARIAKEMGALTVAVVTKPFQFEGTHRMKLAESGLKDLQDYVDTLIIIPNQNLFRIANERTTFADAFRMADEVLHSGVRGVTDLMVKPGLINLDFADIRTVMREMGKAMMGTGEATGERRAIEAAEAAISNPLLDDVSLKGARALLINITGGTDMTLFEVDEAANRIREEVDPEANIIFGSTFNDVMEGRMRVSVVATGIEALAQIGSIGGQKFHTNAVASDTKKPFTFQAAPSLAAKAEAPKQAPVIRQSYPGQEFGRQQAPVEMQARAGGAAVRVEQPIQAPVAQPVQQTQEAPVQQEFPVQQPVAQQQQAFHQEEPEYEQHEPEQQQLPPAPRVMQEPRPIPREPASAVNYQQESAYDQRPPAPPQMQQSAPPLAARRSEYREQQQQQVDEGKGFFKRMADVGRALSTRPEGTGRPAPSERVHVVQKSPAPPEADKAQKGGDDQYLDIPAFLRRQAN